MNWIWNMVMDTVILATAVGLILFVMEWDYPWRAISLGIVLVLYGFVHALLTMKRMGYSPR